MSSKKVFFVMLGVLVLMIILMLGSVVLGDIFLRKQSVKLTNLKVDNQVIETQQAALSQAKADLDKYKDLTAIAKQVVPQDKDQARATREIIGLAEQAGVKIAGITFPASDLGQAKPKAAGAAVTTAASVVTATPTASQLKPAEGIPNVYQLDIIVTSDSTSPATYARLVDFLNRLEQNRRTAQVSQITIQPDAQNRAGLNFTLTITLFIKP